MSDCFYSSFTHSSFNQHLNVGKFHKKSNILNKKQHFEQKAEKIV